MRSFEITALWNKLLSVDGLHIDVRTVSLLAGPRAIGKGPKRLFVLKVSAVDGVDMKIRLHHVQFAEMSAAVARTADAQVRIVVAEVSVEELALRSVEVIIV